MFSIKIIRDCNVQTNEYDLQAIMYPTICTHHRLNRNNGNKTPDFPWYIWNKRLEWNIVLIKTWMEYKLLKIKIEVISHGIGLLYELWETTAGTMSASSADATATRRIDCIVRHFGTSARYQCDLIFNSLYQQHSDCNVHYDEKLHCFEISIWSTIDVLGLVMMAFVSVGDDWLSWTMPSIAKPCFVLSMVWISNGNISDLYMNKLSIN